MWSSGFIGAELGSRHAPAATLLAWRFLIVASVLAAWTLLRGARISRRDLALHAIIGALAQVGYLYGVFAAAQHGVSPGVSALVAGLQPVVTAAIAAPLLGERVTGAGIAGLAVGLVGVAVVVSADLDVGRVEPWAYALPFAGMLSLVAATLAERRARPRAGVLDALAVQCGVSAVCFTGFAGAAGALAPPADPGFWLAVGWTVALSTLGGYGLYWINLARTDATRVSGLLYLTPPATMIWAWLMFGDPMTWATAAGLAVCAAAVALIHGARTRGGTRDHRGARDHRHGAPSPNRSHDRRRSAPHGADLQQPGRPGGAGQIEAAPAGGLSRCACGSPRRPAARP
ncbi:MAG: EamA family transporter [Micromonosporaceae bacterium]|nr:EamA family transporter [Micromonosporaceae bacterium]